MVFLTQWTYTDIQDSLVRHINSKTHKLCIPGVLGIQLSTTKTVKEDQLLKMEQWTFLVEQTISAALACFNPLAAACLVSSRHV